MYAYDASRLIVIRDGTKYNKSCYRSFRHAPPASLGSTQHPAARHGAGLDRRAIFRGDGDQTDFVARVAALAEQGAWTVYAWALLPNHAHLLVRTGVCPLPRSMRSLLIPVCGTPSTGAITGSGTFSKTATGRSWRNVR